MRKLTGIPRDTAQEIRDRLQSEGLSAEIRQHESNFVRVNNVSGGDYWTIFDVIRSFEGGVGKYDLAPTRRNEITVQQRK